MRVIVIEQPACRLRYDAGTIVSHLLLPLTLTFDHRVADGAAGARFAAEIVALLENPGRLLLGL